MTCVDYVNEIKGKSSIASLKDRSILICQYFKGCWRFKVKVVIQWTYHYEWRQALMKAHIVETHLAEMWGLFLLCCPSHVVPLWFVTIKTNEDDIVDGWMER